MSTFPTDCYEVLFWIKRGAYWKQETDLFSSLEKGQHDIALKLWKDKYLKEIKNKTCKATPISIICQ
jgi:hypothetical protein